MSEVSDELKAKIKNLKLVYTSSPQPELLIAIPNQYPKMNYSVRHVTEEFTSLCPLNLAQPDHATITIEFGPKETLVELKSLKYYLTSFRNVPIFHEEVPNRILGDLVTLIKPRWIKVVGEFTVRGGLKTRVETHWGKEQLG